MKHNSAKISWDRICCPEEEGWVWKNEKWNKGTMMINLWPLFMKADTLSLKWVHSYSIKSQCLRAKFFLSVSSASVDDAEADFTSSTHLNEMQEYTPDNGRSLALCVVNVPGDGATGTSHSLPY